LDRYHILSSDRVFCVLIPYSLFLGIRPRISGIAAMKIITAGTKNG
jgi:hypothetical protein